MISVASLFAVIKCDKQALPTELMALMKRIEVGSAQTDFTSLGRPMNSC